jgi:hypothetical protein
MNLMKLPEGVAEHRDGSAWLSAVHRCLACGTHQLLLQVGMNPMKLPEGVAEELELLDELGKIYGEEVQQQAAAKLAGQGGLRPVNPSQSAGQSQNGLRPVNPVQTIQPSQRSSSAAGVRRLRQQQQQQQSMQGLRTYSPDEFNKAFNVREGEDAEEQ